VLIYQGIFIGSIREPYELADRLRRDLHRSEDRLRSMSQRVRSDIEAERKRIARSLHDEMGQGLTALRMDLGWMRIHGDHYHGIPEVVQRMQRTIEDSALAIRRIISDLRPLMLDDLGVVAAARALIQEIETRTHLRIELSTSGDFEDLPDSYQTALYRTLQESLTNVLRHAGATHVDIDLKRNSHSVELTVSDNGTGFAEQERSKQGSFGLFGLSERATELHGTLTIDSAAGHGTRLVLALPPCAARARSIAGIPVHLHGEKSGAAN
jgi:signal transduction histidine kinase